MVKLSPTQISVLKMVWRGTIVVHQTTFWGARAYSTNHRDKHIKLVTVYALIKKGLVELSSPTISGHRNALITDDGKRWLAENPQA